MHPDELHKTDKDSRDFGRKTILSALRVGWVGAVLCVGLVGCQTQVGTLYDPEMDRGATTLQKKMDKFLTSLETQAGHPQADYTWNAGFYDDYLVELRSLRLRAQSHENNEIMSKKLREMMDNLHQLRLAHEASSLAASSIQATRELFNQEWRAIIAQELAKQPRK